MSPRRPTESWLVVTTSFPRRHDDPAGHFVAELCDQMVAAGVDVRVVAPGGGQCRSGVSVTASSDIGRVFRRGGAPDAIARSPGRTWPLALAAATALVATAQRRAGGTAGVVGHWLLPSGLAAAIAARRAGRLAVGYAHGSDITLFERLPGGREWARLLDAMLDRIIFVAEPLRHRFEAALGRPPRAQIAVLPMGLAEPRPDGAALTRCRAAHDREGRRIVLTVGRFVAIKGYEVLADALVGRTDVIWIAAGRGPTRDAVARRCAASGVEVRLVGEVGAGLRDALYREAAVCVVPSLELRGRSEAAPLALMESIAAGCPVVATRTGGMPWLAADAAVAWAESGSAPSLRAALNRWLDDPAGAANAGVHNATLGTRWRWSAMGPRHLEAMGLRESSAAPNHQRFSTITTRKPPSRDAIA